MLRDAVFVGMKQYEGHTINIEGIHEIETLLHHL